MKIPLHSWSFVTFVACFPRFLTRLPGSAAGFLAHGNTLPAAASDCCRRYSFSLLRNPLS
jgi:hypothetical protein